MRPIKGIALALVLILGNDVSRAAAEPTVSVVGSEARAGYRQVIDSLVSGIDANVATAARATHDTPAMYLDLNGPLEGFPEFGSLTEGDLAFLRATKQTYELYRALGGELLDRFAVLQRQDNRYYIAIDGEGGRWVVSVEEALAALLKELVSEDRFQASVASSGSQCPFVFHCLLLATYMGMIESIAYVPRDTTVTLEIAGDGVGGGDSGPILLVPDSMVVHDITRENSDKFMATVSVSPTAPLGQNILSVYDQGHAFRSLAQLGIEVMATPAELQTLAFESDTDSSSMDQAQSLPGTGEFQPLIDDHSSTQETATLLSGTAAGRLGTTSDADLFKIVVEQAGTLSVTSDGPTDVKGTLETDAGNVIATDDDSGERYNFSLEVAVDAGTYFLRVTHCCAGLGEYQLSVQTTLP